MNGSFMAKMPRLKVISKGFFLATLLVLFLVIFGKPSMERYFNEDVTSAVLKEKSEEGVAMPAITLCAINKESLTGWKDGNVDLSDPYRFLERECNSSSVPEIYECIDDKTYTLNETILASSLETNDQSEGTLPIWTKDLTTTFIGNCYTLSYDGATAPPFNSIMIMLNEAMKYYLLIHDRDFFVININPLALSKETITLDGM